MKYNNYLSYFFSDFRLHKLLPSFISFFMDETEGHSCVVLHGDKAVCIPMNETENSDELNNLFYSALLTIFQSEELTQNYDLQLTVDLNAMCITHTDKLSAINNNIEVTI